MKKAITKSINQAKSQSNQLEISQPQSEVLRKV